MHFELSAICAEACNWINITCCSEIRVEIFLLRKLLRYQSGISKVSRYRKQDESYKSDRLSGTFEG
jgi:hypothetical protein